METVILYRDDVRQDGIRGTLYAKGEIFHILERPWLNSRNNVSCIPADEYIAKFLQTTASGKHRNVYYLQNVPGREGILIHSGNITDHTKGCLIIGKRRGILAGRIAVLNSRTALYEFTELMEHEDFKIQIIGNQIINNQILQKAA